MSFGKVWLGGAAVLSILCSSCRITHLQEREGTIGKQEMKRSLTGGVGLEPSCGFFGRLAIQNEIDG